MKSLSPYILFIFAFLAAGFPAMSQEEKKGPKESDYYRMVTIPVPETILPEVGGVATLPDGRVAFCTRRGDVWIIENPYLIDHTPRYSLFATGLHEPLGLAYRDNALYTSQRGELTRLEDTNGDGKADFYKTVYSWPLSGHYHEYSYGPKFTADGYMFVTGNVAFGDQEWWRGESRVPWRGWAMRISPDGKMEPWAAGMRSPCGLGMYDNEFFYADNQGDWFGSGGIWHVKKGAFMGHPASLQWTGLPGSPLSLSRSEFASKVYDEREFKDGRYQKPENKLDDKHIQYLYEKKKEIPELQLPAVWLPHAVLGISNSEIIQDETAGRFGPFAGQLFIGDQGQSKIMRVFMEKVKGEYQGAAFDFAAGFQSGVLRMNWGHDGSMFVGETNRGWGSAGTTNAGLQRLVWTGKVPMEMKTVKAMPDGFEIEFTLPVDKNIAAELDRYIGRSFMYKYFAVYGSPVVENEELKIKGVKVSDDGTRVRLVIDDLRQYFVHEIVLNGIQAADGTPVLHPVAYYTLNNIPDGAKLAAGEYSTKRSKPVAAKPAAPKAAPATATAKQAPVKVLTEQEVSLLLNRNTCSACHHKTNRLVGPSFTEIAKRKYSNEKIVELIYNPQPQNWPDYPTEMPPMPQVNKTEALNIAAWINSLRK